MVEDLARVVAGFKFQVLRLRGSGLGFLDSEFDLEFLHSGFDRSSPLGWAGPPRCHWGWSWHCRLLGCL